MDRTSPAVRGPIRFQLERGNTRVPVRGLTSSIPFAPRTLIASRKAERLTPSSALRSWVFGNPSPGPDTA